MEDEYEKAGYTKGAVVRQYHHATMYDDAIIVNIHNNGALDVEMGGKIYGWSINTCTPISKLPSPTVK